MKKIIITGWLVLLLLNAFTFYWTWNSIYKGQIVNENESKWFDQNIILSNGQILKTKRKVILLNNSVTGKIVAVKVVDNVSGQIQKNTFDEESDNWEDIVNKHFKQYEQNHGS